MSIETYEEMSETLRIDIAINQAEKTYTSNVFLLGAGGVLSTLRRKHFK